MKNFLLIFIWIIPSSLFSQSDVLNAYIEEGLTNNLHLQKEGLTLEQQVINLEKAKGKRLPELRLDASYLLSAGGRTIDVPIGDLFNPINNTLNQLTGTSDLPVDLINVEEQFLPNNFQDTRLKVRYPIFNRPIYLTYKAKKQLVSLQEIKQDVFKQELKKEIKMAYYHYFKLNTQIEILQNTADLLEEVLRFNLKLVNYDKATDDIIPEIEYEIEKNKSALISLDQQKQNAQAYFNTLLNKGVDQAIEEDLQLIDRINLEINGELSAELDTLQKQAIHNRSELTQINLQEKINETSIDLNKKDFLPELGLEGSVGFQGTGYRFSQDQMLATVGLRMNWLIYDGKQRTLEGERLQLEAQKIDKDYQMLQQQIALEVINSFYAVSAAKNKIQTEQAALKSAKKRFGLVRKRYDNQQVILLQLIDAQEKYTKAQLTVSIAEYDFLIQNALLERALSL